MQAVCRQLEVQTLPQQAHVGYWLSLAMIVLVVFSPVLTADFIWDDKVVHENPALRSWNGLRQIWLSPASLRPYEIHYWPLTQTTYWIEYQMWSSNPLGYHATNLILYLTTVLVLFKSLWYLNLRGAWLSAVLFAVHPVHVETVAWIAERKGLLAGLFCLLSLSSFLRYDRTRQFRAYCFSLAWFGCGLLSKSTSWPVPALMLILHWWLHGRVDRGTVKSVIPFSVLTLGHAGFDVFLARGAEPLDFAFSVSEKVAIAGRAPWFYLSKLAWPWPLMAVYPRWEPTETSVLVTYLAMISMAGLLSVLFLKRTKLGRGPSSVLLCYLAALSPTLGLVEFGYQRFSFVADRFQYLASVAPLVFTGEVIAWLYRRFQLRRPLISKICICLGLCLLSGISHHYSRTFKNETVLFSNALRHNPKCFIAHYNLADELSQKGQIEAAVEHYRHAIRLKPGYGDSHFQLGSLLLRLQLWEEAEFQLNLDRGLRPASVNTLINWGNALLYQGRKHEAVAAYRAALTLEPDNPLAHNNLGHCLTEQGKYREALVHFKSALTANEDSSEFHLAMARTYQAVDQEREALTHYRETLRLQPSNPEAANNAAWILATTTDASLHNPAEAISLATLACASLEQPDPAILDTLAVAYAMHGDSQTALEYLIQAEESARTLNQELLLHEILKHKKLIQQKLPVQ